MSYASPREKLFQLSLLDSFVMPKNANVIAGEILSGGEVLLGVYINDVRDFILVTNLGLHWIYGEVSRFVPYASLKGVELPQDLDEGSIDLLLKNGSAMSIPVSNETDGSPDLLSFQLYLQAVIDYLEPPQESLIRQIEGPQELAAFLLTCGGSFARLYGEPLASALSSSTDLAARFQAFGIDPGLLKQGQFYRAIALLSSIRPRESLEVELVRQWYLLDKESSGSTSGREALEREELAIPGSEVMDLLDRDCLRVLSLALEEVEAMGGTCLGAEFLLLALVRNHLREAEAVFGVEKLQLDSLRLAVRRERGEGPGTPAATLPFSAQTVTILEDALEEALAAGEASIRPLNLLRQFLRLESGVAASVLRQTMREQGK